MVRHIWKLSVVRFVILLYEIGLHDQLLPLTRIPCIRHHVAQIRLSQSFSLPPSPPNILVHEQCQIKSHTRILHGV